ncbi:MAG: PAS domain S-box protein [Chloroflexi bacterium]|nr:PAS domain S-box protein [Chloroflexota bacterium]
MTNKAKSKMKVDPIPDNEHQFQQIVNTAYEGILTTDKDYLITYVNPRLCEILGYSENELVGKDSAILIFPEDLRDHREKVKNRRKGFTERYERHLRHKSGAGVWALVSLTPSKDSNGNFSGVVAMVLEDSKDSVRYRQLFETMQEGAFYQRADGSLIDINPAGLEIFGVTRNEFLSRTSMHSRWVVIDEGGRPLEPEKHPSMIALLTGKPVLGRIFAVYNYRRKTYVWLEVNAIPQFRPGDTKPYQVFVTMFDLTRQKNAEAELTNIELKYRTLVSNSPCGIFQTDLRGQNIFINDLFCELSGLKGEELAGDGWIQGVFPEDRERVEKVWKKFIRSSGKWEQEYRIQNVKTGEIFWIFEKASGLFNDKGKVIGFIGSQTDLTSQKQVEQDLRKKEEAWQNLFEILPVGVSILDQERKLVDFNLALSKILGMTKDEVIKGTYSKRRYFRSDQTIMLPEEFPSYRAVTENRIIKDIEIGVEKENGELVWTNVSAAPLSGRQGSVIVTNDFTDRKRDQLEREVIQVIKSGLVSSRDLNEFLKLVHKQISKLLDARNISIVLFNKSTGFFDELYSVDEFDLRMSSFPPGKSIASYVYSSGKPLLMCNSNFEDFVRHGKMERVGTPFSTWLGAPLIRSGEVVGVISVRSYQDGKCYHEKDKDLLESVGAHIALAIERNQSEDALKKSEENFRQLVEHADNVFIRQNLKTGEIEYVSPSVSRILGYEQNEFIHLISKKKIKLFHPKDCNQITPQIQDFIPTSGEGEIMVEKIFRMKNKSGEFRNIQGSYSLLKNSAGQPDTIVGSLADITRETRGRKISNARICLLERMPSVSLQELLVLILDEIEKLTESKIAFYHFVDPDQAHVTLQSWSTATKEFFCKVTGEGLHYSIDQAGVWVECVHQRKPVIHNDYASLPRKKGLPEGHAPFVRELTVPVFRGDKIVSVLGVGNKSLDYDLGDLELAAQLADMSWDLIEQKRIEESLVENEQRFRSLIINLPVISFVFNPVGTCLLFEGRGMESIGILAPDIIGRNILEVFKGFPEIRTAITEALTGKEIHIISEHQGFYFDIICAPIFDINGKLVRVVGLSNDVSEFFKAKKELEKSEEFYRLISSSVSDYVFSAIVGRDGQIHGDWIAGAFETITGYSYDEYVAHGGWLSLVHPDDLEIDRDVYQRHLQGENSVVELRIIQKNGDISWVQVISNSVWDEKENRLIKINGAVKDITEKKLAEEEAKRKVEEFSTLFETAGVFSLQHDLDIVLRTITDRASAFLGVSNAYLYLYDADHQILELKNIKKEVPCAIPRLMLGEGVTGIVAKTRTPMIIDDYTAWAGGIPQLQGTLSSVICVPLLYGGLLIGVLGVMETCPRTHQFSESDIHFLSLFAAQAGSAINTAILFDKIRQNAAELEKRVEERTKKLQAMNKELETFTYTVSHDLKAPLRGISGYSTLLLEDHTAQLDQEGQTYLKNLVNATERMNLLIEDLLTYSRMERRDIKRSIVNIHDLIEDLINTQMAEISLKKIKIVKEIHCETLFTDSEALSQALRNILDNAIKFSSRQKTPVITIHCESGAESTLIWIKDNGVGFDMKFHDKIFEIFQRLNLSEEYPGTGVGLALVRKAIGILGGKVWAESNVGKGSIFFVEIPKG